MIDERDHEDADLARMLRAVRADADPALWTRVRARSEARTRMPALLDWATRPAALASSIALLVAVAGLAVVLASRSDVAAGEEYVSLTDALLAERDAEVAAPAPAAEPAGGGARDSGSGM